MSIWTWKPDTCIQPSCIIEYEGDSAIMGGTIKEQLQETEIRVVRTCLAHINIADKNKYEIIREENQRKNGTLVEMIKIDPDLEKTPEKYEWSFDDQRNLEVTIADINLTTKIEMQVALTDKYGTKVIIK